MKNITNLPKDTACTPASLKYDYSQQENLVEETDNNYAVPIEKIKRIEFARHAVEHASSQEKAAINLDPAFFDKLKDIYTQAYILYMNGSDKKVKRRNCEYLESLLTRSVEAAERLYTVVTACMEAKNALQNSTSGEEMLAKSLSLCSCMFLKLEISVLKSSDNLAHYILDSGTEEGRALFEELKAEQIDSDLIIDIPGMQMTEFACDYYYYRQQESLSDQADKNYTVPIEKIQWIEFTSYAVEHAFDREKAVISLDPAFFDKLKDTYTQAYILYMNGIDKKVKHRECEYLKKLYFRSTEAANRLHTAWHAMEESKNALQHSGSGGKALIESIWSCSCITITLAKFLCDNADNLERYIQNSGAEGRAWYEALRSMEEESEEMHGE
ncbi:hypothetical protein [uncultured Ruminococcus sp.]|uniref:hypothetical protein n=1 Tax=uncultured Ruminococcus sp. TaxID=165186 RepID=UPI0026709A24|nr:hypothetical protein [uncultured Ruminococcus sp.]